MTSKVPTATGGGHLERRSALLKRVQALPRKPRILVVEDREQDVRFIETSLRRWFGPDLAVSVARTLKAMADTSRQSFDVVLLDDRLDGSHRSEASVPILRASGHAGPIIVISALLTNARQAELRRLGVTEMILKDDADGARLAELVIDALDGAAASR